MIRLDLSALEARAVLDLLDAELRTEPESSRMSDGRYDDALQAVAEELGRELGTVGRNTAVAEVVRIAREMVGGRGDMIRLLAEMEEAVFILEVVSGTWEPKANHEEGDA